MYLRDGFQDIMVFSKIRFSWLRSHGVQCPEKVQVSAELKLSSRFIVLGWHGQLVAHVPKEQKGI